MGISIVVPTLNEEGSVKNLVERIDTALKNISTKYEIIFVDDNSTDNTQKIVRQLYPAYPVFLKQKQGNRGKAQSLLEGFKHCRYELIAMIDADLQYPPESLPQMIDKINKGYDIVVANRIRRNISFTRRLTSSVFLFIFGRLLHHLNCDVQSGMKVFKKEILKHVSLNPTPWTFDMEFLIKAGKLGYKVGNVNVIFQERIEGKSKVNIINTSWEIASSAIRLKFASQNFQQ